ncbi:alpha/beta-Hydrolases superfamily protein [Dorcoceras hygrometricum]|uniref:Alpha/beta-Hydrolases superfamily protein n=1 Tax=Dorcoceras hygrometricum TaxID=472368 RepID=A0A2Z7AVE8_9LAMI|nr:alpha/beta-Hydrolases superfamily protein [Dorcoceras hygrometricum]
MIYYHNPRLLAASLLSHTPRLPPLSPVAARHDAPPPCAVRCHRRRTCSDRLDEEVPYVKDSSLFLVQTDEGIMISIVDRIRRTTTANS